MPNNRTKLQHFVPQFLLRRFASSAGRTVSQVWQFSKEKPAAERGTTRIGVESFFYGPPENGVEGQLRDIEGLQKRALDAIDAGESPEHHAPVLRSLIWTLAVRTRALREQYASLSTQLLDALERSSASPEANEAMAAQVPREFDRLLDEQVLKLPPAFRDRAAHLLADPARRAALRDAFTAQVGHIDIQGFFRFLRSQAGDALDMGEAAKKGQIRGLSKLLGGEEVPSSFSPAHWALITRSPGTFVLGDCCVIAVGLDGRIGSIFALKGEWQAVYLPISGSQVLVAALHPIGDVLTDDQINAASVELSAEVFFSSANTDREAALVPRIATGVPLMSREEQSEIAQESWRTLRDEPAGG